MLQEKLANSNLIETLTGPVHSASNTYAADRDVLLAKENKVGSTVISRYDYTVNALGQRTTVSQTGAAFWSVPRENWTGNMNAERTYLLASARREWALPRLVGAGRGQAGFVLRIPLIPNPTLAHER